MDGVLAYYRQEVGESVANRFFDTFLDTVAKAVSNPKAFHPISAIYRRANVPGFTLPLPLPGNLRWHSDSRPPP